MKARLVDARDLADQDSKFTELDGVSVHYKVHSCGGPPAAAVHCYHGFGANTGSWDPVQQQMADRLQAVVSSHDMPGFGLTGRCELSIIAYHSQTYEMILPGEIRILQVILDPSQAFGPGM